MYMWVCKVVSVSLEKQDQICDIKDENSFS